MREQDVLKMSGEYALWLFNKEKGLICGDYTCISTLVVTNSFLV